MAFAFNGALVPKADDSGAVREIERSIKAGFEAVLRTEEGTQAIAPFKSNGSVTGHKVSDNTAATQALIELGESEYPVLATTKVLLYRKSQLLDAVIRQYYVLGPGGKVTGELGPKLLKMQTKPSEA